MNKLFPLACTAFLLAACSTAPQQSPQQAAVVAYLRQNLEVPASYQPVRWGPPVLWRLKEIARADLPGQQQRYAEAAATARHDSADYVLVAVNAAQVGVSAQDVALVKARYLGAAQGRDSSRAQLRQLTADLQDTTPEFYRLLHVYRSKTKAGEPALDSVLFNVGMDNQLVIPYESFRTPASSTSGTATRPEDTAPELPPPSPAPPVLRRQ